MSTTVQKWIDDTRDMLLSGYVEELLRVASNATDSATSIFITGADKSGLVVGVVREIDL